MDPTKRNKSHRDNSLQRYFTTEIDSTERPPLPWPTTTKRFAATKRSTTTETYHCWDESCWEIWTPLRDFAIEHAVLRDSTLVNSTLLTHISQKAPAIDTIITQHLFFVIFHLIEFNLLYTLNTCYSIMTILSTFPTSSTPFTMIRRSFSSIESGLHSHYFFSLRPVYHPQNLWPSHTLSFLS